MTDDPTLFDPPVPADIPVTPYAGTSGWSGGTASKERAERADRTGLTGERDLFTLEALKDAGPEGITWGELADLHGLHHGEASAALSRLHRVFMVKRLTEKRGRSGIYVLPEHVNDRPTEPYRPNVTRTAVLDLLTHIDELLAHGRPSEARREIAVARKRYGA